MSGETRARRRIVAVASRNGAAWAVSPGLIVRVKWRKLCMGI
ncbi:MAG: hypothetical protein ACLSVD_11595 [Eggerthellaceae bacterium]